MGKREKDLQASVVGEFAGADLGDKRRDRRLETIASRLAANPDKGFPRIMDTAADLEGFYRFVRNEAVTFDGVFAPHRKATVGRMAGRAEVLAVHDTTEFRFGGSRDGLGRLTRTGHGFLGHFTLAVTADGNREPLGTLAVEPWARRAPSATSLRQAKKVSYPKSRKMETEQRRWIRAVDAAEAAVEGAASLIHVMDSEADDYEIMAQLVAAQRRWVIRLCYDRTLARTLFEPATHTKEVVAAREVVCTRPVHISRRRPRPGDGRRRRGLVRQQRNATLAITAAAVVFQRPPYCGDRPATLRVNVVSARELNPPPDVEPIEWLLITTEPIDTEEQILRVIDYYRGRWVIEEFFKALKTGCAFEKRQLESWDTLLKGLALFIPVAWGLLRLRALARTHAAAAARTVLTPLQLEVLRRASASRKPLPNQPTAHDAMMAIAQLAGHLRSNGEPGWRLLGEGYKDLLMMVAGFMLATGRSDQS